jgi:hypothetical protein
MFVDEDDEYVPVPPPQAQPIQRPEFRRITAWTTNLSTDPTPQAGTPLEPPDPGVPSVPPVSREEERGGHVLPRELPAGFSWYGDTPTRSTAQGFIIINEHFVAWSGPATGARATYAARIAALQEWASEHGVKVQVNRNRNHTVRENPDGTGWAFHTSQPYRFQIFTPNRWEHTYGPGALDIFHQLPEPICTCGESHALFTTVCPTTGLPRNCANCGAINSEVQWEPRAEIWFCSNCAYRCEDCEDVLTPPGQVYCSSCRDVHCCTHCHRLDYCEPGVDSGYSASGQCPDCAERLCPACDTVSRHPLAWSPTEERYLCRQCHRVSLGDTTEEADDAEDGDAAEILTIPGRENIRMCGIELEGDQGTHDGHTLAMELYRAGLAQHNQMQGYHHGGGSFIHVEADSSVDWEVVIGPLNPADPQQMLAVNSAMRLVRTGIREGRYKLSLRCGLHIHVGAEKFGLAQAYNLNTLFSYVEDVMFRLAAAKWPLHRSMSGSPYCRPVRKPGSKVAFGREIGQADDREARRVALNFGNYFQRMLNNCRCGAVRFDSWEECTCDLGKCTFEFRLFNSTANPRKLHAYMALSQALVAKAGSLPEIENPDTLFPAMTFLAKPFKGMTEDEQIHAKAEWEPRVRWLLYDLPLTDDERESIMYCIKNSELAELGEGILAGLTTTQEVPA